MDIFLINCEKILKNKNKFEISKFQRCNSRIFLKEILKNFYKIESEIFEDNKKPCIKNSKLNFSITHSNYLFAYIFDENVVGIDAEFVRKIDYKKILKRYKLNEDKYSKEDFFQLWTVYEAEYKSRIKDKKITFDYENYKISASYTNEAEINVYEIKLSELKIDFDICKKISIDYLPELDIRI